MPSTDPHDVKPTTAVSTPGFLAPQDGPTPGAIRRAWRGIRVRILGGLLLVAPILLTLWIIYWLYSFLEKYAIDPLALLLLRLVRGGQGGAELPHWFEAYAAPLIAVAVALLLLYCLGFFVHSRLRGAVDWVLLRVPVISGVYNGLRQVFQALDQQPGQTRPQRVVLVAFPHPGMRVPAFVTSTCRDVETRRVLLCVYVPTTPVPTSGYFLIVPEDEVTELDWSPEQALQAIISAGLTTPAEIRYFKPGTAPEVEPVIAGAGGEIPPNP
jgi:uncharacterized membrane protein